MDFGNYSCVASNLLGTDEAFIEAHGRPSCPEFLESHLSSFSSSHSRVLRWSAISLSPLLQHTILYREVGTREWITKLVFDKETLATLTNLTADTTYECIAQVDKVSHFFFINFHLE